MPLLARARMGPVVRYHDSMGEQPAHEPDPAFRLRPTPDEPAHYGFLLDHANLLRFAHPDQMHPNGLSLFQVFLTFSPVSGAASK